MLRMAAASTSRTRLASAIAGCTAAIVSKQRNAAVSAADPAASGRRRRRDAARSAGADAGVPCRTLLRQQTVIEHFAHGDRDAGRAREAHDGADLGVDFRGPAF